MNLSALTQPAVLIVVLAVTATAVLLVFAVARSLRNPARRAAFDEALRTIGSSELDIDTALNRTAAPERGWFVYWATLTSKTGRTVRNPATPGRAAIVVTAFGILLGVLGLGLGPMGLLLGPGLLLAYRTWLRTEVRKRITAMERQLPLLLSGMRANLQAGATPQAAILAVAADIPSPLGDELLLLKRDLAVNTPLEMALQSLAARVPSREMQFLVASMEIAIRSGANLDPQLVSIQHIVAQRTRIRQKLRAAVAQAKPTKYLALGAVPGMFLVSLTTASNRDYWFGPGWWMGAICLVLYTLGFLIVQAMVKSVENN